MREQMGWLAAFADEHWPTAVGVVVVVALWRMIMAGLRVLDPEQAERKPPADDEPQVPVGTAGSMARAVAKWLVLAVVLAALTGYGLYRLLGRPTLPSATSFTTTELLDLLKIGLAVVGGLGAVVALAVAYRKQQVSEAAHHIAAWQEQRERTKFLNERYGKAAEQLGHDKSAVRLAGVYAIVGLADDWPAQRQTCVDVLCGYLRMPYPEDSSERQVRQAIITTLLDHSWDNAWDTKAVVIDFRNVEFENLDLSRRTFAGNFNFDHAVFHGDLTDFGSTTFTGVVTFRGARFKSKSTLFSEITGRDAVIDFSEATFSGDLVEFSESRLTNTTVDFNGATVEDAQVNFEWGVSENSAIRWDRAELRNATIDLSSTVFLPGRVTADTPTALSFRYAQADGSSIKLVGSRFVNTTLNFEGGRFTDCAVEAHDLELNDVDIRTDLTAPPEFAAAVRRLAGGGG
ncbi:pentapeptide repeat-containing protein, partial [Saccharothrix luteola]|uniref:pentapeptide repeat-containing protein n=1 Tax=Saccharothrix luteola TaxID=2893018 RepID=UPI001E4C8191